MAVNSPNSPRQRMINLMYLVFIGMLALNVSSEVLDGFALVEEGLLRSVNASTDRNILIFNDLDEYHQNSPEKTEHWYNLAVQVKQRSDSLYHFTQDLKLRIVQQSDGKDGDPTRLKHPDDLNAAFEVALAPGKLDAKILKESIDSYREYMLSLISDSAKKMIVQNNLSTEPSELAKENKQSWEESMFSRMPLAASVTLLTKIQNDVRYAEGEVLTTLLKNIDVSDYKVNKIQAYVIPESKIVMQNSSAVANIILAAVDTTQLPKIYIDGLGYLPESSHGRFQMPSGGTGPRTLRGRIETQTRDGIMTYPFSEDYMVIQPGVSISPTLMNVLYKGIPNPIEIASPGIANQNITATMTNGTLTRQGENWVAHPTTVNQDAIITISAQVGGRSQVMGSRTLRVRPLPPATAFFVYKDDNGNSKRFKTGEKITKTALVDVNMLNAAIDDGILDINFTVLRFEMIIEDAMGRTVREASNGSSFSQNQKDFFRNLSRGKSFIIGKIVARGPDGVEQNLAPIEVFL